MAKQIFDTEALMLINDQWIELEEKWGIPVDLDTEEDNAPPLKTMFSSMDLRKTTFDSSFLFRRVKRQLSQSSKVVEYNEFIEDLERVAAKDVSDKQFFYINGEVMSAVSIEDICVTIDRVFQSIDRLCSATSTLRSKEKRRLPDVVNCSISTADLSFDDTVEKEKSDSDDVDRFIDEAFQYLSETIATLADLEADDEASNSVTTLVKRFTSILKSPAVNMCHRRKRECCQKFKVLADFWNQQAFDNK